MSQLLQRLEYLNAPELTGWLTKKGGGTRNLGRKSWRRRWFRLRGDSLAYYKSETDKRPIRSIPISSIQRVQTDKDNELRVSIG